MSENILHPWGEDSIARVALALESFKSGKGVLVLDSQDRENEGDLIFPAQTIKVTDMAKLIRYGSGIVCVCITEQRRLQLNLPMMTDHNQSVNKTAFTVSVEAAHGVHTGVSAADRVTTIQALVKLDAQPADLHVPGHVFPLIANPMGVLGRQGHTEAAVDLAKLAGFDASAVICEITNDDGSMAKTAEIIKFGLEHDYPVITIEDLISYRLKLEQSYQQ